tara:strand:- start:354 stop:683 length:330 start_codon:yes stop_codon:yes gene_type:complete
MQKLSGTAGQSGTKREMSRLPILHKRDGTGQMPIGMSLVPPWGAKDYSDLKEKDFLTMLDKISCLLELEGLANRRRILNTPSLTRWTDIQRGMIVQRKLELENMKGKKK